MPFQQPGFPRLQSRHGSSKRIMPPTPASNPTSSENEPIEQAAWLAQFERKLGREFSGLGRALLAVSGGTDSMAMLFAAARSGIAAEVATVDHGLRASAAADVALVERAAQICGFPFHVRRVDLRNAAGVEARARDARYEALRELATLRGLDVIATAHTATDQAETVLMRLTRGSGLRGAAGVLRHRNDGVIRPLLWATRADTERYCAARQLEVANDAMNADPTFLRVRVRQQVLPALRDAAGASVEHALARFAERSAEDEAWLDDEAEAALRRAQRADGSLDSLAVRATGRPIRRRLLSKWLEREGLTIDARLLDDVLVALEEQRSATLPSDKLLTTSDGRLAICAAPARLHGTSSSDDGRSRI